jgi:hypothetical protein
MSLSTTTTANLHSQYNLLDAMGDFTQPEILALVAKCSRTARARLTPLLEIKKSSKAEMYHLITRLFPGIKDLKHHSQVDDASMYNDMLSSYFAPECDLPRYCEVVFKVGDIRYSNIFSLRILLEIIRPELQSVHGRRMLLRAVDEWIKATTEGHHNSSSPPYRIKNRQLKVLDRIKDAVLNNFAAHKRQIGCTTFNEKKEEASA